MSLYTMMNGVNQATFWILPMLGKHPDEYPRFRDCFAGVANNSADEVDQFGIPKKELDTTGKFITVYTRTGGLNRDDYELENRAMVKMQGYVKDYDDNFDSTFAYWVFEVPKKFIDDYDIVTNPDNEKGIEDTSEEYKQQVIKVYPKIADKLKEILYGK